MICVLIIFQYISNSEGGDSRGENRNRKTYQWNMLTLANIYKGLIT
jgi:hypothetical protein